MSMNGEPSAVPEDSGDIQAPEDTSEEASEEPQEAPADDTEESEETPEEPVTEDTETTGEAE